MLYALNVFNLIPGREDDYREYNLRAGRIIYGLGGRVVAAGTPEDVVKAGTHTGHSLAPVLRRQP